MEVLRAVAHRQEGGPQKGPVGAPPSAWWRPSRRAAVRRGVCVRAERWWLAALFPPSSLLAGCLFPPSSLLVRISTSSPIREPCDIVCGVPPPCGSGAAGLRPRLGARTAQRRDCTRTLWDDPTHVLFSVNWPPELRGVYSIHAQREGRVCGAYKGRTIPRCLVSSPSEA